MRCSWCPSSHSCRAQTAETRLGSDGSCSSRQEVSTGSWLWLLCQLRAARPPPPGPSGRPSLSQPPPRPGPPSQPRISFSYLTCPAPSELALSQELSLPPPCLSSSAERPHAAPSPPCFASSLAWLYPGLSSPSPYSSLSLSRR